MSGILVLSGNGLGSNGFGQLLHSSSDGFSTCDFLLSWFHSMPASFLNGHPPAMASPMLLRFHLPCFLQSPLWTFLSLIKSIFHRFFLQGKAIVYKQTILHLFFQSLYINFFLLIFFTILTIILELKKFILFILTEILILGLLYLIVYECSDISFVF